MIIEINLNSILENNYNKLDVNEIVELIERKILNNTKIKKYQYYSYTFKNEDLKRLGKDLNDKLTQKSGSIEFESGKTTFCGSNNGDFLELIINCLKILRK